MSEHPSRAEPLFVDVWNAPRRPYPELALVRGLDVRVASRSPDGSGATLCVDLPRGWSATEQGREGATELFVLHGSILVDGRLYGGGSYIAIPRGSSAVSLAVGDAARVLVFWSAHAHIDATRTSVWDVLREKPLCKLRTTDGNPDGPAGWLFLANIKAGFWSPDEHVHEGFEENILLRGDLLMPTDGRGVMTPGRNLANPPGFWHGPMASKGGALILIHTDEPQTVAFRPSTVPPSVLRAYLETAPW